MVQTVLVKAGDTVRIEALRREISLALAYGGRMGNRCAKVHGVEISPESVRFIGDIPEDLPPRPHSSSNADGFLADVLRQRRMEVHSQSLAARFAGWHLDERRFSWDHVKTIVDLDTWKAAEVASWRVSYTTELAEHGAHSCARCSASSRRHEQAQQAWLAMHTTVVAPHWPALYVHK